MKKKVLICALTVLLAIGMVSCSMDEYAKLGDIMGKMGNNVYGIEPNMSKVNETSEKLDNSVTTDETTGEVSINTDGAADLISSLAEIKNSQQKTSAMKEELSKNVTDDPDLAKAVKEAMKSEIQKVVEDMPASNTLPADIDPAVKDAYESVSDALNKINERINGSDDPTKADLATVTIVKSLAETVKDVATKADIEKDDLIEKAGDALQALDALKVAADAAGLGDILGDISIASLLSSSSSSKAVSNDENESESNVATRLLVQSAEKLVSLVCNDEGNVVPAQYNRALFQLSAIRAAYEISASFVMPSCDNSNGFGYVDTAFSNGSIGLGRFSANDAVLYAISFAFTEADSLFEEAKVEGGFSRFLDSFLEAYVSENEGAIETVEAKFEEALKGLEVSSKDLANRAAIGVNTLCAILSDAKYFDTVKDALGSGEGLGGYIDNLFKEMKGEN